MNLRKIIRGTKLEENLSYGFEHAKFIIVSSPSCLTNVLALKISDSFSLNFFIIVSGSVSLQI